MGFSTGLKRATRSGLRRAGADTAKGCSAQVMSVSIGPQWAPPKSLGSPGPWAGVALPLSLQRHAFCNWSPRDIIFRWRRGIEYSRYRNSSKRPSPRWAAPDILEIALSASAHRTHAGRGLEAHLRSLSSCIWLIGVERFNSTTLELVQRVVTTAPGVKAVILAAYQSPDGLLAALKAGACGFLCQDITGERLIKSLELIALGEMFVYPQFSWGQTAVGQIQASGGLNDNTDLQANGGESHLSRHSKFTILLCSPGRRDGDLGRKPNRRCRPRLISP